MPHNARFPGVDHGSVETLTQEAARYAQYFKMDTYHTVAGGRPLIYVLGVDKGSRVQEGVAAIVAAAKSASVADPYVVFMGGDITSAAATAKAIGAQAVSSYNLVQVKASTLAMSVVECLPDSALSILLSLLLIMVSSSTSHRTGQDRQRIVIQRQYGLYKVMVEPGCCVQSSTCAACERWLGSAAARAVSNAVV